MDSKTPTTSSSAGLRALPDSERKQEIMAELAALAQAEASLLEQQRKLQVCRGWTALRRQPHSAPTQMERVSLEARAKSETEMRQPGSGGSAST